jgi:hypothetical protein
LTNFTRSNYSNPMNKIIAFLLSLLTTQSNFAGTLKGAWEMSPTASTTERAVMIVSDKYLSISVFEKNTYVRTYGGTYTLENEKLTVKWEFNDKHKEEVGQSTTFKFVRNDDKTFSMENLAKTIWKRLDTGRENLAGYWRITQREGQDGKMNAMPFAARRTIKILSEGRFQWIAINAETGEFFGTGGGTYTLNDGKYTENIEFFSRDNNRVGASLSFDYKLDGNSWKHSGKSSTGNRINEIWSRE